MRHFTFPRQSGHDPLASAQEIRTHTGAVSGALNLSVCPSALGMLTLLAPAGRAPSTVQAAQSTVQRLQPSDSRWFEGNDAPRSERTDLYTVATCVERRFPAYCVSHGIQVRVTAGEGGLAAPLWPRAAYHPNAVSRTPEFGGMPTKP
jgi:hypothetical protein